MKAGHAASQSLLVGGILILLATFGLGILLELLWLQDASAAHRWYVNLAVVGLAVGGMLLVGLRLARWQARLLLEADEKFLNLIEATPDAVLLIDAHGRITQANNQAVLLFGFAPGELVQQPVAALVPGYFQQHLTTATSPSASGPSSWRVRVGGDLSGRRKDDTEFPVEISLNRLEIDDRGYVVCFLRDITERKRLEAKSHQSQKLEALGRLASGVAHDFNNLLTAILGFSEMLLFHVPAGDPQREGLEEIKKAGERAADLTQQLLAFSRKQMLEPVVLDLNALVTDMQKLLRRLIREDIELQTQLEAGILPVKVDASQIHRVLVTLATNARDALPHGGAITIATRNATRGENRLVSQGQLKARRFVVLEVTDNGTGMDAATKSHLFEPFFTTKPKGKGVGLGLATVYGILQQSDGHIEVFSEVGRGSTFRIYLPQSDEAVPEPATPKSYPEFLTGTETILLVEDEATVRSLARRILEMHGYRVLEAEQGKEALQHTASFAEPIHLMVTDVIMPQMTGPELAQKLAGERPEMKVMYISGYTDSTLGHEGVLQEGTVFLQKPFTPEALARTVRDVLDRA